MTSSEMLNKFDNSFFKPSFFKINKNVRIIEIKEFFKNKKLKLVPKFYMNYKFNMNLNVLFSNKLSKICFLAC